MMLMLSMNVYLYIGWLVAKDNSGSGWVGLVAFFLLLVFLLIAVATHASLAVVGLLVAVTAVFFPSNTATVMRASEQGSVNAKRDAHSTQFGMRWILSLRGLLATGGILLAIISITLEHRVIMSSARKDVAKTLSITEESSDKPPIYTH
jgi:hypothetical protein